MVENPVIILGAGATKACGGPLTDEILPAALNGEIVGREKTLRVEDRNGLLKLTRRFMADCFHIPESGPVKKENCPSLPMILSMLRRSIESDASIGNWHGDQLVHAKRAIEYSVFAVIEAALRQIPKNTGLHQILLEPLYRQNIEPVVVSLNYDVIVDNVMFSLSQHYRSFAVPDYGSDISTPRYVKAKNKAIHGHLYKIHGSLNWLYCEKCSRLDLFISEDLYGLRTSKALDELYYKLPLNDAYIREGAPCRNRPNCDGVVSPVLITPTFIKDYQNPHIKKVWQEAESAMKKADKAIIIGYSLPTDDVEIALLLKRGLDHLDRKQITIVEYVDKDVKKPFKKRTPLGQHSAGQRFQSLFGPGLDWHTTGFEGWLKERDASVYGEFREEDIISPTSTFRIQIGGFVSGDIANSNMNQISPHPDEGD
jgi:hypothetical protein